MSSHVRKLAGTPTASIAVSTSLPPVTCITFSTALPSLLLITDALDEVQPVGSQVFEALASPAASVPGSVVPRLGSAFWSMTVPVVLVLDDVHLLRNRECRDALSVLADHVPPGSRLVLAGRDGPVRIARLRAEGRVLEIGPGDLMLSRPEAARCCGRLRSRSARTTWRHYISGPKGGRSGCTWRHCTCGKAGR